MISGLDVLLADACRVPCDGPDAVLQGLSCLWGASALQMAGLWQQQGFLSADAEVWGGLVCCQGSWPAMHKTSRCALALE